MPPNPESQYCQALTEMLLLWWLWPRKCTPVLGASESLPGLQTAHAGALPVTPARGIQKWAQGPWALQSTENWERPTSHITCSSALRSPSKKHQQGSGTAPVELNKWSKPQSAKSFWTLNCYWNHIPQECARTCMPNLNRMTTC